MREGAFPWSAKHETHDSKPSEMFAFMHFRHFINVTNNLAWWVFSGKDEVA